jgi:DNA-binding NtrC family response regulator
MSGMSGLELLPKAKAVRPDVPIIMITAYGDPETKRQAFENGAEALLTKPIDSRRCAVRSSGAPHSRSKFPEFVALHESLDGRFCCKSRFAEGVKNSEGRRRSFLVDI